MENVSKRVIHPHHLTGLVLTAGGSRGAYQAGVLQRIGELPMFRNRPSPFPIIAGASAGAINGAAVAAASADFRVGTARLAELWATLNIRQVFRTDLWSFARNGARLAADLTLGGLIGAGRVAGLVDAAPLRALLTGALTLDGVTEAIARGHLYALAVTATGYHSGKSFTFIQGRRGHPLWLKSRRIALATPLTIDHICASAAIPLIFPPVPLQIAGGTSYFGDGAMRLTTPLSPAIRLGADRLLAIGVRCHEAAQDLSRTELAAEDAENPGTFNQRRPPLAQICGVFLNAIFLDHLDSDLEHLERMNEMVASCNRVRRRSHLPADPIREPMRIVRPLVLAPSEDLALIAKALTHRLPRTIRYLLDGLGTPDAHSADLTSYLLFDSTFTQELLRIGYHDANERIDEIEDFLAPRTQRRLRPGPPKVGPGTTAPKLTELM